VKGFAAAPPIGEQVANNKYYPDFIPGPSTGLVWQAFDYYRQVQVTDAAGKKSLAFDPKKVFWSTSPKHGAPNESRLMKLSIDASLAGWKKVEFFDAFGTSPATPVKTITSANDALEWEYKNLTAGAHSFIAKVTAADDKVHITHPAMAIFAP
jgi:hypothetical protein